MKPAQLRLMMRPGAGTVHLASQKPGQRPILVKEMTDDFVLMQAAELLREDCRAIETDYKVSHTNGDVLEVRVTVELVAQYNQGQVT